MGTPLRVLFVGDFQDDLLALLRELRRGGYEPTHARVETPAEMEATFAEQEWDVILADYGAPLFDAPEALKLLQSRGLDLPFIVVSGKICEETAVEAMEAGAHDYIERDRLARLNAAVGRELREARVRRDYRRAKEALEQSEERFRRLEDGIVEGVVLSENGEIFDANDRFVEMFGYEHQELAGMEMLDLVSPEYWEEISQHVSAEGTGYHESLGIKKDGTTFPLEVRLRRIPYQGRQACVTSVLDLTEREETKRELDHREELYRTVVEQAAANIFLVDAGSKSVIEANAAFHRSLGYTMQELEGLTLYDLVAHDRQVIDHDIGNVLTYRKHVIGEQSYRSKDGSLAHMEVNATAIYREDREIICVSAHDITERKYTEQRLHQSLDALLATYEAGHILSSTLEAEEIGARLLQLIRRISSSTTAVISVPEGQRSLRVWQATGFENLWRRVRYTARVQGVLRRVLESGEHVSFRMESPENPLEFLVGLFLPLNIHNRTIGVLEVYGTEDTAEKEIVDVLLSLTTKAASALENARLYEELAESKRQLQDLIGKLMATQEEERRRVAYEVHDGPTQMAVAAYQRLQAFARQYPPDSPEGHAALQEIQVLARLTVGESRQIIENLRPTTLDNFGLSTAIRLQTEALRSEGWQVSFEENLGDVRMPDQIETALYRVGQEALVNVRKHTRACRVHVRLETKGGWIRLRVRDWGGGFDSLPTSPRGPGERVGMTAMRERISLIGGRIRVRSKKGLGTLVAADVPLPAGGTRGVDSSPAQELSGV